VSRVILRGRVSLVLWQRPAADGGAIWQGHLDTGPRGLGAHIWRLRFLASRTPRNDRITALGVLTEITALGVLTEITAQGGLTGLRRCPQHSNHVDVIQWLQPAVWLKVDLLQFGKRALDGDAAAWAGCG